MFNVTAYNGNDNAKIDLGEFVTYPEAILSADDAYWEHNFDGATVTDLNAMRQVYAVGINT